eukprot:2813145-Alexandrium_andersonii.AAC.1
MALRYMRCGSVVDCRSGCCCCCCSCTDRVAVAAVAATAAPAMLANACSVVAVCNCCCCCCCQPLGVHSVSGCPYKCRQKCCAAQVVLLLLHGVA